MVFCPLINADCRKTDCIFWYKEKLHDKEECGLRFSVENSEALTAHLEELTEEIKKIQTVDSRELEKLAYLKEISLKLTKLQRKLEETVKRRP